MRALLASEWTKLRSVRSTYWSLLVAAVLAIALGLLVCHETASRWPRMTPAERADTDLVSDNLAGFAFAQLAVGVLGVLAAGSEYTTGLIRLTFGAVPHRRAVLAAKAALTGSLTLVAGVLIAAVTFAGGQAFLASRHLGRSLADTVSLRVVLGVGFYAAMVALLGLGLGFLIRHTAGAITILVAVVFLVPQLARALPKPWGVRIGRLMFQNAAQELVATKHDDYHLAPLVAAALAAAYAAVALLAAAILLERRDA
jgi:ABC-2 type transport system permease protein